MTGSLQHQDVPRAQGTGVALEKRKKVLIVDDETAIVRALVRIFENSPFEVVTLTDALHVMKALDDEDIRVVLTDIFMPGVDGIELCNKIKALRPAVEVIAMTGSGSVEVAVDAMKAGAYDFLTKPFENSEVIRLTIAKAIEKTDMIERTRFLESQIEIHNRFQGIVGRSPQMTRVFGFIDSVSPSDTTVLILGESGTGKELVVRAIHEKSRRSSRRFIAVNCSAFSETLLESELFGHTKGAFTGATNYRKGLFEDASGGTLFLDEIGDTSPAVQAKLLRALQNGEIKPIGSNDIRKVDVRVIAATNANLEKAVKEKRFREDLLYRLNVITIELPPLRERVDDIPLLVHHFLRKYEEKMNKKIKNVDAKALAALTSYRWPGNVRELENAIERAVVLANQDVLNLDCLPNTLVKILEPNPQVHDFTNMPYRIARRHAVSSFDRTYLESLLSLSGGVVAEAARRAEMDRSNFRRLLQKYEISASEWKDTESR